MTEDEINSIIEKASELKNLANSKVEYHIIYPAAQELYRIGYELVSECTDIPTDQKEFLSAVYLYESLDCKYSIALKEKKFSKCVMISHEQQNIIKNILTNYNEEDLIKEEFVQLYQYLKDHSISAELREYFPIGLYYFEQKEYTEALTNFRKSEEILEMRDFSNLSDNFRDNYELNKAIIKFNISQCQIGISKSKIINKEFLERQIIKGLLESLELNRKIVLKSSDSHYAKMIEGILSFLGTVLEHSINSWQTIYDYTRSEELFELMHTQHSLRANAILKTTTKKVDYLLFYTHGFNTRGEWKNDLTEVFTNMQNKTDINFVLVPWDYGKFKFSFFSQLARSKAIARFEERYEDALDLYGKTARKCLIAHSFGTYITGTAIKQNENFTFDRIIFAGNILSINYDWESLKSRNQISQVLIEKSTNDLPVLVAKFLNKFCFQNWIGYAGRFGFTLTYDYIKIIESKSGHSEMLTRKNMIDNWFPFLTN
ncbi:hypothetical protein Dfri01_55830 [Dyadobacter frigoris]|uniref:hypothetical protein n=1 Tax=Dyadobacter frigoris TaxID=2576211 RepID=UPI0024A3C5FA|nr:hypothetical protein [Dyadobacter frigoris]GLU56122.1 hypothetical protein Dfri01_55830 [Dyadobacter frigoris]